ncbi:MAG TPA: radical SAM protein, partial [Anaerolineales bacterium]|nr:radical SAM protein [Anaerolineales bacterium]
MPAVATIDFHITSECNQECPYCWGPQGFATPISTRAAQRILRRIATLGIRRIVFTGGDPALRPDLPDLVQRAKRLGLEVALSTSGDALTPALLRRVAPMLDLISLPLDGATEAVSRRTKQPGHRQAVWRALRRLTRYPAVDVKVASAVTRHNLSQIPRMIAQVEAFARGAPNRVFYNVFQAFPRAMVDRDWGSLLVTNAEFDRLRRRVMAQPHAIPIHWLDHTTLDRLYVMILPDGSLTVPSGADYLSFGPFLDIPNLDAALRASPFDIVKHTRHARGWSKR